LDQQPEFDERNDGEEQKEAEEHQRRIALRV